MARKTRRKSLPASPKTEAGMVRFLDRAEKRFDQAKHELESALSDAFAAMTTFKVNALHSKAIGLDVDID